jgi:hypothetical protein
MRTQELIFYVSELADWAETRKPPHKKCEVAFDLLVFVEWTHHCRVNAPLPLISALVLRKLVEVPVLE